MEMEVLDPKTRGNPERLGLLLGSDFVEFGSSGRVYHKYMLIDMMVNEQHAAVLVRDFNLRELSGESALDRRPVDRRFGFFGPIAGRWCFIRAPESPEVGAGATWSSFPSVAAESP